MSLTQQSTCSLQSWNTRQAISVQLFEMSLCTNRSFLVSFTAASSTTLIDFCCRSATSTFLHHSQNQRIEVLALGRPHVRSIEFRSFTTKLLHCLTCPTSRCIFLLKDVNFIIDASDGWLHTTTHTTKTTPPPPSPPPPPPPLLLLLHSYTLLYYLLFWRSLQVRPSSPKDAQRRTPGDCWCKYFTGQMPFLSHNQQCQSTEGRSTKMKLKENQMYINQVNFTCYDYDNIIIIITREIDLIYVHLIFF